MGEKGRSLWRTRLGICVVMVFIFIILGLRKTYGDQDSSITLEVAAAIAFAVFGLISWDILSLNPSDDYTLFTTLFQYIYVRITVAFGQLFLSAFLKGTSNLISQQEKLLFSILSENKNTTYGSKYKFEDIQNVDMFRNQLSLTTHSHYNTYIKQICKGKENIMTKQSCVGLVRTSGTTGKPKLIPWNRKYMKKVRQAVIMLFACGPEMKGRKQNLNKNFGFSYKPVVKTFSSGLEAGPFVYILLKEVNLSMPFYLISPNLMSQHVNNENTAFYIYAVFALRENDLFNMQFSFISQVHGFWKYVEKHLEQICLDIENGTLDSNLDISEMVRDTFEKQITPDQQRALEVKKQFQIGLNGLAKRLWPSITYLRTITMKTMAFHTTYLKQTIYKDVLFLTLYHGASEGIYGFDVSPIELNDQFTLAYDYGFFEFIQEAELDQDQPDTLLAHQLEIGQRYELVVTNELGLCRYRSGDVVQVSSYQEQCPVMEMMYRNGQLLNVFWEKTPESVFCQAVSTACKKLGVTLEEYTATESINIYEADEYKKSYTLFIETETKIGKEQLTTFDGCLCEIFDMYRELRSDGSIECMDVVQVAQDTFLHLKHLLVKETQTLQFKMPRVIRIKEHLNFLMANQI